MNIALRHGMATVEREVAAPPEKVWDLLVDLRAWPKWGPTVERAELDEPGLLALGSRGRVWTPFGLALPFTITEFDPGRSWRWEVAGIPATRHEVWPTDWGARVVFGAPWWAAAYLPVFAVALQRIERMTH